MNEQYEIKNQELFKKLDALIEKLPEVYFNYDLEEEKNKKYVLEENKKIVQKELINYIYTVSDVESGRVSSIAFEPFDNEDTLHKLIELAKNELEK